VAINFPGPYEVEYSYNTVFGAVTLTHVLRVNCAVIGTPTPGDPPASISVQTVSGTPSDLPVAVNELWEHIRTFLHTSASAGSYILWKYTPGTFAKTFVTSGAVTNPAGTSAQATRAAHYVKFTWRTAAGGIMGLTVLEEGAAHMVRIPQAGNPAGDNYAQLVAYAYSSAGWMLARDDSFPIIGLNMTFGENEAVFKARYR